jgi:hypothetical protein
MEITELSFTFASFQKGEIGFFVQTQKVHNAKTHLHKKGWVCTAYIYIIWLMLRWTTMEIYAYFYLYYKLFEEVVHVKICLYYIYLYHHN